MTGTYDLSFYLAGLFIALSGLMLTVLPGLKRYRRYKIERRTSQASIKVESGLLSCCLGGDKNSSSSNGDV